ncbi:MAG TPA: hypothetical protein VJ253_01080 [Dehalococcoidia bacterium]|nr:hypothetical protein [Dehalococcoidia bacterium]
MGDGVKGRGRAAARRRGRLGGVVNTGRRPDHENRLRGAIIGGAASSSTYNGDGLMIDPPPWLKLYVLPAAMAGLVIATLLMEMWAVAAIGTIILANGLFVWRSE